MLSRLGRCLSTAVLLATVHECLAETETCYGPGEVAGITIAVLIVTVVLVGLVLAALWQFKKKRDLYREASGEGQEKSACVEDGKFAFDNPYFRDDEPDAPAKGQTANPNHGESLGNNGLNGKAQVNAKNKKPRISMANPFTSVFTAHSKKQQRTMDDSCLAVAPERILVPLRGHDFTGLGFNVCGNMRDGIFVKDVLHRGPASESGKIKAGDRILSVTVSFSKMVYEDALTILSYASPYDVQLELEKTSDKSNVLPTSQTGRKLGGSSSFSAGTRLFHPLYRSQSIDDLTQIGKDQQAAAAQQQSGTPKRSHSVGVVLQKSRKPEGIQKEGAILPNMTVTGSLNERMLANAIVDEGRLKRSEQKREENPRVLEAPKVPSAVSTPTSKDTTAMPDSTAPQIVDGESLPRKGKRKAPAPPKPNSVETTAQIHQIEHLGQKVEKKESSSSSSSLEKDSIDGSMTAPFQPFSLCLDEKKLLNGNDSDVSSDSLENENHPSNSKKMSKDRKRRSSSLGDLTMLQEAVNLKSPIVMERAVSMELSHQGAISEGSIGQRIMLHAPTINSCSTYSNGHTSAKKTVQNITLVTSTPHSRGEQEVSELEVSGICVGVSSKTESLSSSSSGSDGDMKSKSTSGRKIIKVESSLKETLNFDDPEESKEVIQISQDELDDVMMSHRQFLLKQAKVTGVYSGLSPDSNIQPTDFESWSFTDKTVNGKNTSKESSMSYYNTALEAPSSEVTISTKKRNPEISELTIRTPEGNITNAVIISTSDALRDRTNTLVESDTPPPRLEPPH